MSVGEGDCHLQKAAHSGRQARGRLGQARDSRHFLTASPRTASRTPSISLSLGPSPLQSRLHGREGKDQAPQPEECVQLGPGTVWSSMRVRSADLWPGQGASSGWPEPTASALLAPRSGGHQTPVSGMLGLTWHLRHPAELEITHIGAEGKAVGPREDGHP